MLCRAWNEPGSDGNDRNSFDKSCWLLPEGPMEFQHPPTCADKAKLKAHDINVE
jgi:hypothetical protein